MKVNQSPVSNLSSLMKKLADDVIGNSSIIARIVSSKGDIRVFATPNYEAGVAMGQDHFTFYGDWKRADLPGELMPKGSFFVSSSPPEAIDMLQSHYEVAGMWPSWHYLAPESYGPGPWDDLGPIKPEEVPTISKYWTLSDDPEREMTEKVRKYDSACIRVGGTPASWCGLHFEIEGVGNMGFAHTLEEHRRKGYAGLVTKALVNRLAARDRRATVHVLKDNQASNALCKSLGFKEVGELTWAEFAPRT